MTVTETMQGNNDPQKKGRGIAKKVQIKFSLAPPVKGSTIGSVIIKVFYNPNSKQSKRNPLSDDQIQQHMNDIACYCAQHDVTLMLVNGDYFVRINSDPDCIKQLWTFAYRKGIATKKKTRMARIDGEQLS